MCVNRDPKSLRGPRIVHRQVRVCVCARECVGMCVYVCVCPGRQTAWKQYTVYIRGAKKAVKLGHRLKRGSATFCPAVCTLSVMHAARRMWQPVSAPCRRIRESTYQRAIRCRSGPPRALPRPWRRLIDCRLISLAVNLRPTYTALFTPTTGRSILILCLL